MKNMSMFKKLTVICFLMLFSLSFISPLIPTADAFINIDVDPKEVGEAVIKGGKWVYNKVKNWITGSETCECNEDPPKTDECDEDPPKTDECDEDDEDKGDNGDCDCPPIVIEIHVYDGGQVIFDQK